MIKSNYLYFLTNNSSINLLKEEIKLKYPQLKIAYSNLECGFLTYKSEKELSISDIDNFDNFNTIFSYASGLSIDKAKNYKELETKISLLAKNKILNSYFCFQEQQALNDLFSQPIKQKNFKENDLVDLVLDIIKIREDNFFIGIHQFGKYRTIFYDYDYHEHGQNNEISTSLSSPPSRAYYKIKEALALSNKKIKKGECVLDIGSSPGGISYFFLQHGLHVVGIDAAKMHETCLANKNFTHLQIPLEKLEQESSKLSELSNAFDWIVVDINLDPEYVLSILKKLIKNKTISPLLKSTQLKGFFFTVKLTRKFSIPKIPSLIKNIEQLGFEIVFCKQLPSNKSEFTIFLSNNSKNN
ncbi:MAG: hypothetical protein HQK51_05280 [Oligoflexia bacterium]|nr:hypothetical protein [Oligoflexia bacterium]